MDTWRSDIEEAIEAFLRAAELAGTNIAQADLVLEFLAAPHRPPARIPSGKMAVYAFWGSGCWLKIGKVGPHSHARYANQHYNSKSAQSTLAGCLQHCPMAKEVDGFDPGRAGEWIKANTHRINILISAEQPPELLSFLEAFLHLKLRPRFEGAEKAEAA